MKPYLYVPNFFGTDVRAVMFQSLWNGLAWLDVTEARREYWTNELNAPYTYGTGRGQRTYQAQPDHLAIAGARYAIRGAISHGLVAGFEGTVPRLDACFVNGYANEKNALGWHADDDPAIDHADPIAVVSLGAARSIMFRPKGGAPDTIEQITLGDGSLLLMLAGMQQTHEHKIPRHSAPCGPRISLTYRSLLAGRP